MKAPKRWPSLDYICIQILTVSNKSMHFSSCHSFFSFKNMFADQKCSLLWSPLVFLMLLCTGGASTCRIGALEHLHRGAGETWTPPAGFPFLPNRQRDGELERLQSSEQDFSHGGLEASLPPPTWAPQSWTGGESQPFPASIFQGRSQLGKSPPCSWEVGGWTGPLKPRLCACC